jgi:hypothetical protein
MTDNTTQSAGCLSLLTQELGIFYDEFLNVR